MLRHLTRAAAAAAIAGACVTAAPAANAADHSRSVTHVGTVVVAEGDNDNNKPDDNTGNWGLAGLLGALGLAGLIKGGQKVREHQRTTAARTADGAHSATRNH